MFGRFSISKCFAPAFEDSDFSNLIDSSSSRSEMDSSKLSSSSSDAKVTFYTIAIIAGGRLRMLEHHLQTLKCDEERYKSTQKITVARRETMEKLVSQMTYHYELIVSSLSLLRSTDVPKEFQEDVRNLLSMEPALFLEFLKKLSTPMLPKPEEPAVVDE